MSEQTTTRGRGAGTDYKSHDHLISELERAAGPYRALLQHELRSATANEYGRTDNLTDSYEYYQAYQCSHQCREPVRWTLANGITRVTLQCVACGDKHSTGVSKADYDVDALPELDEELIEAARAAFSTFRNQLWELHQEAREQFRQRQLQERSAEWWARYNAYLLTPQWRDKRRRVLERDGHVCQACLRREAEQVHHLTYERVFDEPLFDLASVCTPCHNKLHPHMSNGQPVGEYTPLTIGSAT